MEKSIKKVIWEQVFPEDAELRIQQAFEMLLGDEFGLTNVDDYMSMEKCSKSINLETTKATIPKELRLLALEAKKHNSSEAFLETLGVPEENIVWIRVFGSSVEGKPKPNDIDIFVAVKDGSMKFRKSGGLCNPIVKEVGKLNYFIMPESEAEDLLNAMLYTGRKDQKRLYQGKTVEIKSLRDFYFQANFLSFSC